MKKNNVKDFLKTGIILILLATVLIVFTVLYRFKFNSILFGMGCGFGINGLISLYKYFKWSKPENIERYKEKQELDEIELQDERKERLRNLSGRYAYILGLVVLAILTVVLSFLNVMGIIYNTPLMVFVFTFLVFQYIVGIVIFRYLNKKY